MEGKEADSTEYLTTETYLFYFMIIMILSYGLWFILQRNWNSAWLWLTTEFNREALLANRKVKFRLWFIIGIKNNWVYIL